jgi:protoheme IX farnesyltransferase
MIGRFRRLKGAAPYLELCKIRVSLLAAGSAMAGFAAGASRFGGAMLRPGLGVFWLACGACALNQYQDRRLDALMERTKGRPLPAGSVSPRGALALSSVLIGLGACMLLSGGPVVFALGLAAVAWYNGLYAWLKRVSAFAAVPGALTGVLPPAIGWAWAGGSFSRPGIWFVGLFFFLWQVPHFWLVAMERGPEYKVAGLPALTDVLSGPQIRRIVSQWVLAAAACSLLLVPTGALRALPSRAALLAASLWLGALAVAFFGGKRGKPALLFREMNVYMLVLLALLCLDPALAAAFF